MIRGIYTATAGMVTNVTRQQATINNLTNMTTPGYKEDVTIRTSKPEMLIANPAYGSNPGSTTASLGTLGTGIMVDSIETNLSQGALKETGHYLDFAIDGTGFFTVQGADGQTYYTRNGSFVRDAQGQVVTSTGEFVLGNNGAIVLPEGEIQALADGTLLVDGNPVDQLRLAGFADGATLEKMGNSLFRALDGALPGPDMQSTVYQGYLESANVDEVRSMVDMMSAMRAYETEQKVLSMQDQVLGMTVSELGRV